MRRVGRPRDAALDLRIVDAIGENGEGFGRLIARLHLHGGPIYRPAIKARRRPGFQAAQRKTDALKRQRDRVQAAFAAVAARQRHIERFGTQLALELGIG